MSLAYRWPRKMETMLIEYLATQPNYWDTKNRDYYKKTKRREVLSNVKKILSDKGFSVDVNSISKKFKNLRTMFIKEYKKAIKSENETPENIYEPSWEHYNHLLFLRGTGSTQHIKRSKEVNHDVSSTDGDTTDAIIEMPTKSEEKNNNSVTNVTLSREQDDKSPCSKSKDKSRRKRKSCSSINSECVPASKMRELAVTEHSFRTCCSSIDDDANAFGCLVGHKLRRLSMVNQTKAQADIILILEKYILAELEDD